jgi:hypothetical protein
MGQWHSWKFTLDMRYLQVCFFQPWFEKIIPDEPSIVVIPYDASTDANVVKDHVFNIIQYFVGRVSVQISY